MPKVYVNIYTNPKVEGEFTGNEHATIDQAIAAAMMELRDEPDTRLVRTEERDAVERS